MRYQTAGAFRSALEARLLALSRQNGMSLARLRKLVIFDRSEPDEKDPHRALRYRIVAQLDGRRFDNVVIDIGLDYPVLEAPDRLRSHSLLTFADIEPLVIPALSLERHLAEKFHAYTRLYQGGAPSTRVKDFIDIILIGSIAEFQMHGLMNALHAVFGERDMQPLPERVPAPPASWRTSLRVVAGETETPTDARASQELVAKLLDPVLAAAGDSGARWDPVDWAWNDTDPPIS